MIENAKIYKAIGHVQSIVARSETLDEALRDSLRGILEHCSAEYAVAWYADEGRDPVLRPYYWVGPVDITSKFHRAGEGAVRS
ncbi:MAG: hypothetical protein MJ161_05275 [Clostridia bacterium]|nr:hypothetical protein [Clostridia bacterium]